MELYIETKQKNQGATSIMVNKMYITVDDVHNIESTVIEKFVKNTTWSTLLSWKVVARLDGACNTIAKEYYADQAVCVEAAKEYYADTKEGMKLIKRTEAIIYHKLAA
ncbi:hypothetical protein [Niabella aurantiaca]|uniref:hypothetical protein n=1 Tax=Niabella aurantiaca TaxID=379900 RepID=UPI00035D61BC|nr:hypothetical protein [Niabella aurantiaca]